MVCYLCGWCRRRTAASGSVSCVAHLEDVIATARFRGSASFFRTRVHSRETLTSTVRRNGSRLGGGERQLPQARTTVPRPRRYNSARPFLTCRSAGQEPDGGPRPDLAGERLMAKSASKPSKTIDQVLDEFL